MFQQYTDFKLSGPPGLDLELVRRYSSRHYLYESNANPINNNFWGGSIGHGWFLSTDMRATVAIGDMVHRRRIFVESSGEMETYEYNQDDGYFYSRDPKNKNRVSLPESKGALGGQSISSIVLETPTGITYVFEELIFQRDYLSGTEYDLMPCVRTFMVSRIKNEHEQSIVLEYESFQVDGKTYLDKGSNRTGIYIIGEREHWFEDVKGSSDKKGYYKRLKTIIDGYQRRINFNYDNTPYQVTSIDYINGNGSTNTIHYKYNLDGYLEYVYLNANNKVFPGMSYRYTQYKPSFKKFYYRNLVQGKALMFNENRYYDYIYEPGYDFETKSFNNPGIYDNKTEYKKNGQSFYADLEGQLLTGVTSALGAKVEYSIEECLTDYKSATVKRMSSVNSTYNDHIYVYDLIRGTSTPVYTKKDIFKSTTDSVPIQTYHLHYPRYSSNGRSGKLRKTPYIISYARDESNQGYYFDYVEIETPDGMPNKRLTYVRGLLTKVETIGTNKHQSVDTTWDEELQHKTIDTLSVDGVQLSKTIYNYNEYQGLIKVEQFKGTDTLPYQTTKTIYSYTTNNAHKNNYLLYLPSETHVYSSNGDMNIRKKTEYTDIGQPQRLYHWRNSRWVMIEEHSYDEAGYIRASTSFYSDPHTGKMYSLNTSITPFPSDPKQGSPTMVSKTVDGHTSTMYVSPYSGRILRSQTIFGDDTVYIYDDADRVTSETKPDGSFLEMMYSDDLKSITISDGDRTITRKINSLGQLEIIDRPDGETDTYISYTKSGQKDRLYKGNAVLKNWDLEWIYGYDDIGRIVSAQKKGWNSTTYTYPDLFTVVVTDPKGRVMTTKKDVLGRIVERINTDGTIEKFSYNNFNNAIMVIDPKEVYRKHEEDSYGRVTAEFSPRYKRIPTSKKTKIEYSEYDMVKEEWFYDVNENSSDQHSLPSEINVRMIQGGLFPTVRHIAYSYDYLGRLQETYQNNQLVQKQIYDEGRYGQGRLSKVINRDDNVETSYEYDLMGRIEEETTSISDINITYTVKTSYTKKGLLEGTEVKEKNINIEYKYEPKTERLKTTLLNGQDVVTYTYYTDGRVKTMTLGNGIVMTYTYDSERDDLIKALTAKKPDGSILFRQEILEYDEVGNIKKWTYSNPISNRPMTRSYTYNLRDELTQVDINDISSYYTYLYDKNRNATTYSLATLSGPETTTRIFHDDLDQLEEQNYSSGKKITLTYDGLGRTTSKTKYSSDENQTEFSVQNYTYNYQDQLKTVTTKTGEIVGSYKYNHKGERVYKGNNKDYGDRYYYWDGQGRIIGEGDTVLGDNVVTYVYSGNEKIAMTRPDLKTGERHTYYFINNLQGTPLLIVDEQGNPASKIQMDEFGNLGQSLAQDSEINYTGKKQDPETHLYYFNQRYYDSEIGRFLTHDPANQLYNPYVYAGNNPVRFVDPTGETFFEALTFAGALFGAAIGAYQGYAIGGNVGGGAFEGALSGIMIGGTLGLVMDAAQVWGGSTSTYGSGTGRTAWGMYVAAWNGKLGASVDVPFGGSEPGGSNSSSASSASSTSIDYKRLLNNRHQLYFDGSSLSAKDSYGTMLHRWEALSNSKSEYLLNGKTPQGTYLVDSIYLTIESGMVDKNGVGYKARLQYKGDNWPSERDIRTFYIHPDGGYVGATNGCIGVSSSCSQEVYDYLTLYIRSYSYIYVNVRY